VPGRIPEVTSDDIDSGIPEYGLHFVHGLRWAGVISITLIGVFLSLGLGVAVGMRTQDAGIGAGVGGGILIIFILLCYLCIMMVFMYYVCKGTNAIVF
jgi:hypothetical protein